MKAFSSIGLLEALAAGMAGGEGVRPPPCSPRPAGMERVKLGEEKSGSLITPDVIESRMENVYRMCWN